MSLSHHQLADDLLEDLSYASSREERLRLAAEIKVEIEAQEREDIVQAMVNSSPRLKAGDF